MPAPSTASSRGTFRVRRISGRKQPFRWAVTGANGEPLANGNEAYAREIDCRHGADRTMRILAAAMGYRVVKQHASRAKGRGR